MSLENSPFAEQPEQAEGTPQAETPFEVGEPVVVPRSSGEIDYHWKVIGQNQCVDQKTGMTIMVTMVQKVVGDKVYTESVPTAELREIQRKMDDKLAIDLGESAVGSVVEVSSSSTADVHLEDPYDRLLNGDGVDDNNVESAIVDLSDAEHERMSRERRKRDSDDAANEYYAQKKGWITMIEVPDFAKGHEKPELKIVPKLIEDLPDFLPQTRKATPPDRHSDGEYHGGIIEAIAARSGVDSATVAKAALESIARQRADKQG